MGEWRPDRRDRQLDCRAAYQRSGGPAARQAPRPDSVPGRGRAPYGCRQRSGGVMLRPSFAIALRQRDVRTLLGAFFVDETCSWGYTVVLAAYAYERTGSTGWIAVIACTRWITGLIVSGA